MSWSIEGQKDDKKIKELRAAINKARRAKILMFAAANDQGYNTTTSALCYPAAEREDVFCIGEATDTGHMSQAALLQGDYTFPGGAPSDYGSFPRDRISGSSLATAYAAGFAALIIYVVQITVHIGETCKDKYGHVTINQAHCDRLRLAPDMRLILDFMFEGSNGNDRSRGKGILPINKDWFPDALGDWEDEKSAKIFVKTVGNIMRYVLIPDILQFPANLMFFQSDYEPGRGRSLRDKCVRR